MNNLEELKNLEEIQKAVDELKEKIINLKIQVTQEKEEDNKYKRERKKKDEQYYCLGNSGEIWYISDLNANEDIFGYSIGNYFETEKQAENYRERLLIEQQLKDIAMELNKGKEINWRDINQPKYCLYYRFNSELIDYSAIYHNKIQGTIYCLDENFKDVAIKRIGEERLTKYLKGELD